MSMITHPSRGFRAATAVFFALLSVSGTVPALAMEKIGPPSSINKAILHGLKNQDYGLYTLLGPNWVEGPDGALLNIYSPFMLLATQITHENMAYNTSKEHLKTAREKLQRMTMRLNDPHQPQEVKFAVSFFGDRPEFAAQTKARIEGFGRGREVVLTPSSKILDNVADPVPGREGEYSAINAYYFKFEDLDSLSQYQLILTKPDGTVIRTLWGELAWQLGGKKAFARIQADDERATSPGDVLRELFVEYGPCLILIDEWVAYARQLHDQSDLPGGSFSSSVM